MLSVQTGMLRWKPFSLFVSLCGLLLFLNQPDQSVVAQQPPPTVAPTCDDRLPNIKFLGDGPGTFTLEAGFETFIVKRVRPFRFILDPGVTGVQGQRTYTAVAPERVWSCDGNCELPAIYHDFYEIGRFQPGQTINLVVIDDDDDDRRNYFAIADPLTPYQVVEEQGMVQYVTFDVPQAGTWYYYAADSIGVAATCVEPTLPTPTPTLSLTTTPTASITATPTASPVATATVTATATITPLSTVTQTPAATATATTTATPTAPVGTPTATPTPTLIFLPTGAGTPTPTPVIPPTAIELLYLAAIPHLSGVELRWETAIELDFIGFRFWRSTDGQRANAMLITPNAIARRGGGSTGATYTFVDESVPSGYTYTYWLEKVRGDGTVEQMRATAIQLRNGLYLPLISR